MIKPMSEPSDDTTSVLLRIALVLSGIAGAAGVVALALSSHSQASNLLGTAAQLLLFHAPVFLGIGVLAQVRSVPALPAALVLLTGGLLLFCGDLLARDYLGHRLFPMSAPIGGMMVIVSWVFIALGALRIRPR